MQIKWIEVDKWYEDCRELGASGLDGGSSKIERRVQVIDFIDKLAWVA